MEQPLCRARRGCWAPGKSNRIWVNMQIRRQWEVQQGGSNAKYLWKVRMERSNGTSGRGRVRNSIEFPMIAVCSLCGCGVLPPATTGILETTIDGRFCVSLQWTCLPFGVEWYNLCFDLACVRGADGVVHMFPSSFGFPRFSAQQISYGFARRSHTRQGESMCRKTDTLRMEEVKRTLYRNVCV